MRNAIITGASKGIGWQIVQTLSRETDVQVLAVSRDQVRLEELAQSCNSNEDRVQVCVVDLNEKAAVTTIKEHIKHWEQVDILVNNAGYLVNKPAIELSEVDIDQMMSVNYKGPLRIMQGLFPEMQKAPRAHVVNIGSMGGFQGSSKFPGLAAYSASKAALASLSECLAEEWKEEGIAVNCLALGAVNTEMLASAFPGFVAPVSAEEMGQYIGQFALHGHEMFNGKVLPVTLSTP